MNDLFQLRRAGWGTLLLAGWLAVNAPAGAASGEPRHAPASPAWQPVFEPLAWHRERWRQRRRHDPSFIIELPGVLFDPYHGWEHAPPSPEPPRPPYLAPRERGEMWRDDVVGSGRGSRIEVHPEGRILRSRPRGE
ncbi:hypothetical protein OCT51_07130 [Halomonas sp. LR3S48]|uniref:hypothetical protein n=1 Tax=Halomonadaceae TaxID=28256 RepID=UPI0021E42B76|nr:hypothetical protein [Halomonas sp. LR3S48]UYG05135.1 hypothetical protein OCT51_07130 [Halomonas sp. LR3S48]